MPRLGGARRLEALDDVEGVRPSQRMRPLTAEPHVLGQMGAGLRAEVERQLLADLEHYRAGSATSGCTIDWSHPCQEGHCTDVLGGVLEEMSSVFVLDREGILVAEGWVDFVHGGATLPLHVFWLFLDLVEEAGRIRVKDDLAIPEHVWARLDDASKDACAVEGIYDSRWSKDPKVEAWRRDRGQHGR